MNSRVRQVLPRATGGFGPMASPARIESRFPVPVVAGNAVRHATAKAPDGAGAIGAAGHVVAPALPADGPGSPRKQSLTGRSASHRQHCGDIDSLPDGPENGLPGGPRSVTRGCYAAAQDDSTSLGDSGSSAYTDRRRLRYFRPAPDQGTPPLDRIRGDRLRRTASCRTVEARSGFGRAVSLSFEPAPQNSGRTGDRFCFRRALRASFPPRIRREIVARARS